MELDDKSVGGGPALSPLAIPAFRALWIGNLCSNLGSQVQLVGASWLMVALTPSPHLVALVQVAIGLPIMLLSIPAGVLADIYDRRMLMIGAQVFMTIVSAALAVCAWSAVLTPWSLLALTFMLGCGVAAATPAWQTTVADLVPRQSLSRAVAINSLGFNLTRSIGPVIGGIIVAVGGAGAAFGANAVSYTGLIFALVRWRPSGRPDRARREHYGSAMAQGISYVASSPELRRVMIRALLFAMAASVIPALLPLQARNILTADALTYGLMLGAFGVGAVLGAAASGLIRQSISTEQVLRTTSVAMAIGTAGSGATGSLSLTAVSLVLAGASWVIMLSTFNVAVQLVTPRWVIGRALAAYQVAVFGGLSLGSWMFGTFAEYHAIVPSIFAAACLQLAGCCLGFVLPFGTGASPDPDP